MIVMGFMDVLDKGLRGLLNGISDFFQPTNDATCAKCIKCRQCIKTLSIGQVRVFSCPAVDEALNDDSYIDSLLPDAHDPTKWPEYLAAYQEHRDEINKYIYNRGVYYEMYTNPIFLDDYSPVTTFKELTNCYQAIECPRFKPFIDTDNTTVYNEALVTSPVPDISSFQALSQQDKQKLTGYNGY